MLRYLLWMKRRRWMGSREDDVAVTAANAYKQHIPPQLLHYQQALYSINLRYTKPNTTIRLIHNQSNQAIHHVRRIPQRLPHQGRREAGMNPISNIPSRVHLMSTLTNERSPPLATRLVQVDAGKGKGEHHGRRRQGSARSTTRPLQEYWPVDWGQVWPLKG